MELRNFEIYKFKEKEEFRNKNLDLAISIALGFLRSQCVIARIKTLLVLTNKCGECMSCSDLNLHHNRDFFLITVQTTISPLRQTDIIGHIPRVRDSVSDSSAGVMAR